ncbi:hypothetical protein [Leptospira johnsonii]|uniref:Uncharacterized protein n=1 Tax=Leptospira johnsonii TaxID=1917820 RepID=A0A2P2D7T0_9LEPT|nr:hypothetical protein [Leptospira johnsonii]GBF40686.1 hypothetical protein LPTSP1_37040 [Leptospira johnsonii]
MAGFGDVIGGLFGSGGTQQSEAAVLQALINQGNVPTLKDINLQTLGPAAQASVYNNPMYSGALNTAIQQTQGQTGQGFTQAEEGNLNSAGRRVSQQAGDNANRIAQQAASRGVGGSGVQMATQAAAGQQAANAMADLGAQGMMGAQNRALGATQNLGQLGLAGGEQYFGQGMARAGAQDTRDQYNNQLVNQQEYYNKAQKPMNQYGMQSGASQGVQGALQGQAGMLNQNRGQNMNLVGGLLQGAGSFMGSYL